MNDSYIATIPPLQFEAISSIEIVSELNVSRYEHWGKSTARHKKQANEIKKLFIFYNKEIELPCTVILTRLCRRFFDEDNNITGFKWIKDALADCILKKELKTNQHGTKDSDPRITWKYSQEKSPKKGIKIQIYKN